MATAVAPPDAHRPALDASELEGVAPPDGDRPQTTDLHRDLLEIAAESSLAHAIIEVRRATEPEDLTQVALVLGEQRAWVEKLLGVRLQDIQPGARPEYAAVSHYYMPPRGTIVLAKVNGDPSGVLGVHVRHDARAELKRFYVRPQARGLGLGRSLLAIAMCAARSLDCTSVYAETFPAHMPAANHIFRQVGFRDTTCELTSIAGVIALELKI
jgi:GNAT superfamily N-acetyltransferase